MAMARTASKARGQLATPPEGKTKKSGEYHLDLIVGYGGGAVPVILPHVAPPSTRESADADTGVLSPEQLEAVRRLHPSDAVVDHEDSIMLCVGSQVLNVTCGGSLYQDVEHVLEP
ncbi:protein NtpR-like [Panicum miliaceum]|uniref:Protein NtpR-like n=1 Tax=Panicum miliaceum TaxID=4540 RepID=A0A3L6PR06_PANMI|nr:protein NtpR-like [Panicum miliaceum]